jgi:hypothetical protein
VDTDEPSAFLSAREFGRVLLAVPTIYLALPLVCAHWAIVRGWAEPHYLASFGLMPAGAVVVYTPRDERELEVCFVGTLIGASLGVWVVSHYASAPIPFLPDVSELCVSRLVSWSTIGSTKSGSCGIKRFPERIFVL